MSKLTLKENFKYPILTTFFDIDSVPCVFVDEVLKIYPRIDELTVYYKGSQMNRTFYTFGWEISKLYGKKHLVMSSVDVSLFISLYRRVIKHCKEINEPFEEVVLCEIAICEACNELLMPDDECYSDENTGEPLCDGHSAVNEMTGNYYNSEKISPRCLICSSMDTKNDIKNPETMKNCNICGSEWNIENEVTLNGQEIN